MDYTTQKLSFKIKKVARYIRLYGVRRTLLKVQGQYHMKRQYADLPVLPSPVPDGGHVGLIGCGNFAFSTIAFYLRKNYGRVIRATMDHGVHRAASIYETYRARYYTDDATRLVEDPQIDLIYIASNHATHAEYAIQALRAGKSVHIEKPHVVNEDQLRRLCRAMSESEGRVGLGFNRPQSFIGRKIQEHLASQSGPAMMNWFLAGHEIPPDHWYFKEEEGGRVLGNLCHWTDFLYQMAPEENRYPITIHPTRAEQSDCDIAVSYVFGDGSIAAVTFSAKGHTFEGVRESFAAHRGNVLISMSDFHDLTVEVVERKHRHRHLHRNHGHEARVKQSYEMVRPADRPGPGSSVRYVWETGELFLKTDQALRENREIVVKAFEPRVLDPAAAGAADDSVPSSGRG